MKPIEQFRIIRDPDNEESTQVPKMPLVVILENRIIGEAKTLRGAVALVVGNEYFDAEDAFDDWHYRVEASRRAIMKAIGKDIYGVTYDQNKGIIENNYAADPGDPDYKKETDPPIRVRVENEKLFLLSLMKLGSIVVLEREDSYLLRPNDQWKTGDFEQRCEKCIYYPESSDTEFVCPVYNEKKRINEGKDCSAFGIKESSIHEYKGGTYIDIIQAYDLDELIQKVEMYY